MATKRKVTKKHFVAVPKAGGGYEMHRLKDWLRDHPASTPAGSDPGDTSHELRAALKKSGWTIEEAVICFKPQA